MQTEESIRVRKEMSKMGHALRERKEMRENGSGSKYFKRRLYSLTGCHTQRK